MKKAPESEESSVYREKYEMALERYRTWSRIFSRALSESEDESLYGRLSDVQSAVLSGYVAGKTVHDLGAGDLKLSRKLLRCGASRVVAIDKVKAISPDPNIQFIHKPYSKLPNLKMELAFLSWPDIEPQVGLLKLLQNARTLIYLGKNTDGMQCGWPQLFSKFIKRELLEYVEEDSNTLIILGRNLKNLRAPTAEELAAL